MTKTIFHPGKPVLSSWLNASQYLGPSNKGVAFVANPIGDWEYPLLDATSLDLPNFAQYFVSMSGDQAINGVKTFNAIPQFPTSSQPTGQQGVNVDRLNLDLATQNASLTTQINNLSTTTVAALAALTTNLNTNFVNLASTQTITGAKTFNNIFVPALPSAPNNPVSFQYYSNNTVLTSGNQTILGNKNFAEIQVPLIPTVPKSPISLQHFNDNAVVDTGDQTVAGVKTFLDPRVPLLPNVVASPISAQYFNDNAVIDTGNQTIAGVKTFANPIVVPDGINANHAASKNQLDDLVQFVLASGNRSGYLIFGSILKFVWGQSGAVNTYDGSAVFTIAVPGFPGFTAAPCLTVGAFGSYQSMFGITELNNLGFSWSSRNLDNNRGIGAVDFLAIGV